MEAETANKKPLALDTKTGRSIARVRAAIAKEIETLQVEGEGIAAKMAAEYDKRTVAAVDLLTRLIDADDSPYNDSLLNYDLVNAAVMVEAFAGTKTGKESPSAVKKLEREFINAVSELEDFEAEHRKHLAVLYG